MPRQGPPAKAAGQAPARTPSARTSAKAKAPARKPARTAQSSAKQRRAELHAVRSVATAPPRPRRARPPRARCAGPAARQGSAEPRRLLPPPRVGNPDRRLKVALLLALFVLSLFGGRLVQLQGLDASALAAKALEERSRKVVLPAHRGDIVDAHGAVLATTVERRNIVVDQTLVPLFRNQRTVDGSLPDEAKGVAAAARALAPLLGMSVAEVTRKLTGTKRYAVVAKDVEPDVWRKIARLSVPGIAGEQASRRTYPNGAVGASLVGFLGADGSPLAGIERSRQSDLAGERRRAALRAERRRPADPHRAQLARSSRRPGRTVRLTIDRDLQWKTQETLAAAVRCDRRPTPATRSRSTPKSGDVLALASVADVRPQQARRPRRRRTGRTARSSTSSSPGRRRKVITAAAALEEGVVTPASRFRVDDEIRRGGKVFHDSHHHPTREADVRRRARPVEQRRHDHGRRAGAAEAAVRLPARASVSAARPGIGLAGVARHRHAGRRTGTGRSGTPCCSARASR